MNDAKENDPESPKDGDQRSTATTETDVFTFMKKSMAKPVSTKSSKDPAKQEELGPYVDDLDYLQDHFKLIAARIKLFDSSMEEDEAFKYRFDKKDKGVTERQHLAKAKSYERKVAHREKATLKA